MPRSQRNDNFIDKTFTILADILLQILPTTKREREAFTYYRDGMSAQSEGEYAEALQNYYKAMRLEIDSYDRSYILYNIGLTHTSNGKHAKALEYYFQALERNSFLPQALNNMAVIRHHEGNRPFNKETQRFQKLGSIKLLSIGNKQQHLPPVITLKHRIGQKLQDVLFFLSA
uniref:Photosystem I assembly protein Ycf3 n=1 Tax=Sphaeropteris brunoniana TaxID=204593 RepID=A0A7L8XKS2_9MONI|nr:photosystem I assembly protein Ycf3 [Sphaeropteris brunoniana]YP_010395681.1 hypothetical chloroplast RF34 [Cyathea lepifera]QOH97763.1 photosystem I assembly protein Ycf3 [Sphaeropteris brunoniana]UQJ73756.1 hypothetical chloroplast RF34 [Cyathea lepifera]